MAPKSVFLGVVLVVLLCLVILAEASDCNTGHGWFNAEAAVSLKTQNRKLFAGLKAKKQSVKSGLQGSATSSNVGRLLGWELRNVPSGPDPMHHNGGSPQKPRTP